MITLLKMAFSCTYSISYTEGMAMKCFSRDYPYIKSGLF